MDNRQEASVDALRRESERTRAALSETVTELRERVSDTASEIKTMVSPAHIKKEIRTFVREERDSLRETLERKVRANPLQAAAVAAAIGFPALGLLRAIPMPLMLIGAGLFMSSARGKQAMADVTSRAGVAMDEGLAKASEIAGDLRENVAQRAEPLTRALSEAGEMVTEQTDNLAKGIRRNVLDIREAASDAASRVTGAFDIAQDSVTDQVRDVHTQASSAIGQTKGALMDWVHRNPLAVAGIGAVVGAFIAAALPPSTAENAVLGSASDALKDKARDAASDGLSKAKDVASDLADTVKAAAAREGLDAEAVTKSADNLTRGVKAIAEQGLKTALHGSKDVSDAPETTPTQTEQGIRV